jgi:hypothetical protein
MSATAHPKSALRPYLPSDAAFLADIFRASIEELTTTRRNSSRLGPPAPMT